jgi:hypothetical protein
MAKKPPPPEPTGPTVDPAYGIELVRRLITAARALAERRDITGADIQAWNELARAHMSKALGADNSSIRAVLTASGGVGFWMAMTEADRQAEYQGQLAAKVKLLTSCITALETEIEAETRRRPLPAEPSTAPKQREPREVLEHLLERFHAIAQQLRRRHGGRPPLEVNDEYDVQYLVHALLRVEFQDIRPEEHTPSYAGGSSRMDFLLKAEQIVVEVKCTRETLTDVGIGEELLVDIAKYRQHPNCRTLVCFVYDPKHLIRNPAGLENDLSGTRDGLVVSVLIRPKP